MNLVERIAGAARLLATGKLAQSPGFEGAQIQRRLMAWRAGSESINSLILQGGELQRGRARQLVRTNPYAANAAASFTAHAVGCGIKPSSLVEDGALKDQIQRLWLAWTDEADADGLTDFYGLQAMAARAMFEAGECFFRFRSRRPGDPGSGPGQAPLTVPLQLQMPYTNVTGDLRQANYSSLREGIHVKLDDDGTVHVPEVHTAIDCGFCANPERVRSQIGGAAVMGMTLRLNSAITYEKGRVMQSNFHDYDVVRTASYPLNVHTHIVEHPFSVHATGVGEPGVPPFAPALCNAIFQASWKRIRELPIRQEDLRKA